MFKTILTSLIALSSYPALAQSTASADGVASLSLNNIVTITSITDLYFGTLLTKDGGTVTLTPGNPMPDYSGDVTPVSPNLPRFAQFRVSTPPNVTLTILTGDGAVTDGTRSISFSTNSNCASTCQATSSGVTDFIVGGIMMIPANAVQGTYRGTYDVTVSYQ